jgi:hypothetical protein
MNKGQKATRTWDRGKPRHIPTDVLRAQVSAYQICGVPHHEIAHLIGVNIRTLLKYYQFELTHAKNRANAIVNQRLFAQTKTNPAAAIFWHKAQMGWRETQQVVLPGIGENPALPPAPNQSVSEEEATAAYLELIKGNSKKP